MTAGRRPGSRPCRPRSTRCYRRAGATERAGDRRARAGRRRGDGRRRVVGGRLRMADCPVGPRVAAGVRAPLVHDRKGRGGSRSGRSRNRRGGVTAGAAIQRERGCHPGQEDHEHRRADQHEPPATGRLTIRRRGVRCLSLSLGGRGGRGDGGTGRDRPGRGGTRLVLAVGFGLGRRQPVGNPGGGIVSLGSASRGDGRCADQPVAGARGNRGLGFGGGRGFRCG
jgi:hypothetical protein